MHLPYNEISLPFTCRILKCRICGKGRVPDVLFTTVEPPKGLEINGRGCFLQAKILRLKRYGIYWVLNFLSNEKHKSGIYAFNTLNNFICLFFRDLKGENNAKEISEALPFVEYEIHRQLINKLKMKGMFTNRFEMKSRL